MPSVVGTSTNYDSISWPNQQKGFFAAGRFWVFYSDGVNAGYESAVDPDDWSGAATSIGACTVGQNFAVWFDGTYVHYVRFNVYDLFYRRGTPNSDGTITWSADEQLVFDGVSTSYCDRPCVAVGTDGYAYISVRQYNGASYFPYALKNANVDGTWSTASSFQLKATSSTNWRLTIVALTANKVYVVYTMNTLLYGRLYDGGWGAEESDLADYNVRAGYCFTAVAEGDDVHLAYTRVTTLQIRYNRRVYGVGWGAADVLLQDSVLDSTAPALCINPANDDLHCFWIRTNTDHVFYKKCVGGVWDVDPTDWLDESADGIYANNCLNSFREVCSNRVVLLYTTKLASPYNVKFAFIALAPPVVVKQWGYSVPFSIFRRIGLSGAVIRPQQENVKLKAGLFDRKALSRRVHGKAVASISLPIKVNVSSLLRRKTVGMHGISVVHVWKRSVAHGRLLRPTESSAKVVGEQRFDLVAEVLGLLESTYSYMFVAVVDDVTCQQCMQHDTKIYTQDDIARLFPYATQVDYSLWMVNLHPSCRCMCVLLEIGP